MARPLLPSYVIAGSADHRYDSVVYCRRRWACMMTWYASPFPGILASAMLALQLPLCLCVEVSPLSRGVPGQAHHQHGVALAHGGHEGGEYPHHSPGPAPEDQGAPCPESCKCEAQKAILVSQTNWDIGQSPLHLSLAWLHGAPGVLPSLPRLQWGPDHASGAASVMEAAIFSEGNPCAHLSRWLC